jgi:hypothetical protein
MINDFQRTSSGRILQHVTIVLAIAALLAVVGCVVMHAQKTAPTTTAAKTSPWGDAPAAPEEDLANWDQKRLADYQGRLAKIAAWAKATFSAQSINPDVALPPALNGLITHGPIEAIVRADGQVILLVQFYDVSISSGSTGIVYASTPLKAEQITVRNGSRIVALSDIWTNSLTRQITPNMYRAELDEEVQDLSK